MSSKELREKAPLPLPNGASVVQPHSKGRLSRPVMVVIAFLAIMGALSLSFNRYPVEVKSFDSTVLKHDNTDLCPGGVSFTGRIPLTDRTRQSFFWFFQAQRRDWKTAPTILTFGGGPGFTGLSYPLRGESHCQVLSTNNSIRNSWAWTKRFNLLALDHPIGVGFSTGRVTGGSDETAKDVYVFLQRFFALEDFKDLAKNRFIISTGSYGGIYAAHIATVILSSNRAIAQGQQSGIKIDLDSVMLNGPVFDGKTYYRHLVEPRCETEAIFNSRQCDGFRANVPECLRMIQHSLESGQNGKEAEDWCEGNVDSLAADCLDNISLDPRICYPQRKWIEEFIKNKKLELDPANKTFEFHSRAVYSKFRELGDGIQNTQPLYESLVRDGVRILAYVGKLDYICPSLGTRHFLSLLDSRIARAAYRHSRHPGTGGWTIGRPGDRGEITLVEVAFAGHLSISDQPEIIEEIIGHWIDKKEFLKFHNPRLLEELN